MAIAGIRIFLGVVFFTSGLAKLFAAHQFPNVIGPIWLESKLAPYGLGLFARWVAYSQVTIGFLLLSKRFATIGAVMLVPLISNILVVTISLGWRGTPYVNSFLLFLNLVLLWSDREKLLRLLPPLEANREIAFAAAIACIWLAPAASQWHLALGYVLVIAAGPLGWFAARRSGHANAIEERTSATESLSEISRR